MSDDMEIEKDVEIDFDDLLITDNYMIEDVVNGIEHGIYVSSLAGKLARELNLDRELCHDIEMAGLIHDIGKLKIAPYIYGRDENTMEIEEMRYVRKHANMGYEIAKEQGYSDRVCEFVLHHHENYDGSGYPDNLRGNDISIGARVLRVCDVFAALVSDRPYRKAFDINQATELIIDEVQHFDMEIFLAFQSVIHQEKMIKDLDNNCF